tara:strand:+ start:505 stop:2058 length:1554 start_codon:yes stop_codon:yes gene_type:complete
MTDASRSSTLSKWILPILIAFIGSGFGGAWLSSAYSEQAAKREITAELIKTISDSIIQTSVVPTNITKANNEKLSVLLTQKEQAFLIMRMTRYMEKNYSGVDFSEILPAINSIQTRYSYARIYEAAGMVDIVCENLSFSDPKRNKFTLSSVISKCNKDTVHFLEGVEIERTESSEINWKNQNFTINIKNDYGNLLCNQRTHKSTNCSYSVDLTDRLENLPYEYMIITEYMGFTDPPKNSMSFVNFSIVKKITNEDRDRTYWDYDLDVNKDQDKDNKCDDFFDDDESTIALPLPPELDNFDRMTLRACGPIRGSVSRNEFKQLINDFYDTIFRNKNNLPVELTGLSKTQTINEFYRLWNLYGGFNHIFCGDWDRGSIGGFHNTGRYLQLQMEGQACYQKSPREEVKPGFVYTIGAESSDGKNKHPIKGYSYNRSALNLFTLATNSFYTYLNNDDGWERKHNDLWEKNIFVRATEADQIITYRVLAQASDPKNKRTYGIKTIYPDLTPNDNFKVVDILE